MTDDVARTAAEDEAAGGSDIEPAAEIETSPETETPPVVETETSPADETPTEDVPLPAEPTGPRTVARLVADALRMAGVRYAFTVPGESFLGLLEALDEVGIRVVATRHEGGAAFMAEAHGNLTGRPAACIGTRAVGAANLAIGIHTARQDSTPMFALVGQVERAHRGHEAFQEIDQVGTIGGLAKWAAEPTDAADVATILGEALRQVSGGRPGPVLLSLPEDLLDEPVPADARVVA
ncbi:MAG TPA: thiamine pyrophosphate-binding protein, partial [Candidatus Limnocylindrales bacterium]|nr:thiamine pyrophosphate-binding protein [Candidatus Limnocylindrales bacterium]